MDITITGKQLDTGDAFKKHIENKLIDIDQKYFGRATHATVTISSEGNNRYECHISIKGGHNILVQSRTEGFDVYSCFDEAAEKVAKQLRRYKTRLRDHHERIDRGAYASVIDAIDYTLPAESEHDEEQNNHKDQGDQGDEPVIIAEMKATIHTMSVRDAVMRMNLAGENAWMFKNAKTDAISMVFKRSDGNIGWIDVTMAQMSEKAA